MTKEEIKKIVINGNTGEYSHVIICCDTFDYEDYPVYVRYGEDIKSIVAEYNDCSKMSRVMEIYNYNLDLEKQLCESRSYHIEPLFKSKKNVNENESILKPAEEENDEHDLGISEGLKKAINYASKMHKGQRRKTGEPYINHPLHVVQNVLKYKKSKNLEILLISACLHDTLEDTEATYYDISKIFGPQVASLVLELTTDEDMKKILGKQQYLSIKMKNMSSWALVIKLCDRLDNINDLFNCDDDIFKNKYIIETIEITDYILNYAKLSNTHISIIEEILYLLIKLNKDDKERITKLTELINKCSRLKVNLNNQNDLDDVFSKLIEMANRTDDNANMTKKLSLYN